MSIGSTYDAILEDMECPRCGHIGMETNGSYEYFCPHCDYEGSLAEEPEDNE